MIVLKVFGMDCIKVMIIVICLLGEIIGLEIFCRVLFVFWNISFGVVEILVG